MRTDRARLAIWRGRYLVKEHHQLRRTIYTVSLSCQWPVTIGGRCTVVDTATPVPYLGGMTAEDTRAQVLRLARANPTMSAAQIGRALEVSRQRVAKILSDAGFKLDCRWTEGAK